MPATLPPPTPTTPSFSQSFFRLVEDHVELANLDIQYETCTARRTLMRMGVAALCFFMTSFFISGGIAMALTLAGLSAPVACVAVGAVWGIAGGIVLYNRTPRDPRLGEPFSASKRELSKTLQWIQKRIS